MTDQLPKLTCTACGRGSNLTNELGKVCGHPVAGHPSAFFNRCPGVLVLDDPVPIRAKCTTCGPLVAGTPRGAIIKHGRYEPCPDCRPI